jgi:2'-phosphotransferase
LRHKTPKREKTKQKNHLAPENRTPTELEQETKKKKTTTLNIMSTNAPHDYEDRPARQHGRRAPRDQNSRDQEPRRHRGGGRGNGGGGSSSVKTLSKRLSWLLRHGAIEAGVPIDQHGWVSLADLFAHPDYAAITMPQLEEAVRDNNKQRFSLDLPGQRIRANQGHSLQGIEIDDHVVLTVADARERLPFIVHGTYRKNLASIMRDGLSRMTRQHVHFAKADSREVISGMRATCEIVIHVDLARAIEAGLVFVESANGVILTAGDANGRVPPHLFTKVLDRKTGHRIEG